MGDRTGGGVLGGARVTAAGVALLAALASSGAGLAQHGAEPFRTSGELRDFVDVGSVVVTRDLAGGSAVATADFDQDGRIDIAGAGYYEDSFAWWRNLGHGEWEHHPILTLNGALTIRAADIDGDGDIDLYGSSRTSSAWGEDALGWFENKLEASAGGVPSFVPHKIFNFPNEDPYSLHAADFDGDGSLDIAVAFLHDPHIHIFHNRIGIGQPLGKRNLTKLSVPGVNGVSFVQGDDFDGDGDIDIVAATPWDWSGNHSYYWFRNDGAQFSSMIPIAGGLQYSGTFVAGIADIDGDGWKDLVTSSDGSWGNPYLHWIRRLNAAGTTWSEGHLIDGSFYGGDGSQSIEIVDLDRDGDMDIVGGSYFIDRKVRMWLNDGNGHFAGLDVESGFGAHGVTTGDLNGDGSLEVIAADWGGCCYWGEIKYWQLPF